MTVTVTVTVTVSLASGGRQEHHGHGHGHGVFILATSSKEKWKTNPTPSFTQYPSAGLTEALVSEARSTNAQNYEFYAFYALRFIIRNRRLLHKVCRYAERLSTWFWLTVTVTRSRSIYFVMKCRQIDCYGLMINGSVFNCQWFTKW